MHLSLSRSKPRLKTHAAFWEGTLFLENTPVHHQPNQKDKGEYDMKSKFKYPFQIFFLIAIMLSPIGGVQYAQASTNLAVQPDAVIITHNLSIWEAVYVGFVNANTFEKWQFTF